MLRVVDGIIIAVYILIILAIGGYTALRQKNKDGFLMAGRKMHWFPLSLSVVASGFSAISFIAAPGYVYAHDMAYMPTLFMGFLSIPVVFFFIMPFLYRLSLVSIYEYLETRFCPLIRNLASALFIISKLGYLAMVIYVSSFALASITGVPLVYMLFGIGAVSVFLAMSGGMEGMVWADLVQYFLIVFGACAVLFWFLLAPDCNTYWDTAVAAGKTRMFDWSFNWSSLSVWAITINCTLIGVSGVCTDQTNVQRMLAAKNVWHSMNSYFFSVLFGTPIIIILYVIGAFLFGYAQVSHDIPQAVMDIPDKVFPFFIAHRMPPVLSGLVLAAILAAGISTISSVQHSLTSLFMVDWYERIFHGQSSGKKYVLVSRMISLIFGLCGIGMAFYVMAFGDTILAATAIITSIIGAPMGGIYFLGIFTKRANSFGVLLGGLAGIIIALLSWLSDKYHIVAINFMWVAVFGLIGTFVIGYLGSLIPLPKRQTPAAETQNN